MTEPVALPSSFWRRASVGVVPIGFVVIALAVRLAADLDRIDVVLGTYGLVGVIIVIRAWFLRRRPAPLLDDEGIKEPNGTPLVPWSEMALIWVSDDGYLRSRSVLRFRSLTAWTAPSLHYAQQTGFAAGIRFSRMLATTPSAAEIVEQIRRFTLADVRTGDAKDLRRLLAELRSPEAPEKVVKDAGTTRQE